MPLPAGFINFSSEEPPKNTCVDRAFINGVWVALLKPFDQWPQELYQEYLQDLYFVFPSTFKTENYNTKDQVCLCATVNNCPKKLAGQLENRACSEYRRGLCVEASIEANNCEPLALGSIARFHGLSKQRVHQIYNSARKRLIKELAQDTVVQEYLADVFMGKREMPTPEQIAEFIERAIKSTGA